MGGNPKSGRLPLIPSLTLVMYVNKKQLTKANDIINLKQSW